MIIIAKPQLTKRNVSVVTKPVNIVINRKSQVIPLNNIKKVQRQLVAQSTQKPPQKTTPQASPQPLSYKPTKTSLASAVTRNKLTKRSSQPTPVKYITVDPTPESIYRISSVRGIGRGKVLLIIGNGPSILEAKIDDLKNHPRVDIMTVNKPDSRLWPTKFWTFFDQSQLIRNESLWNNYDGIIFNSTTIKRQKPKSMQFKNIVGKGWSRDLSKGLNIGRSSVFASMQIGAWMEYDHIYIFGCDMNPHGVDGKLHFYGNNPDVDVNVRKERFIKEAEFYDHAADLLSEKERAKFTFCSSYNYHKFVDKFNKIGHRDAVEQILKHLQITYQS